MLLLGSVPCTTYAVAVCLGASIKRYLQHLLASSTLTKSWTGDCEMHHPLHHVFLPFILLTDTPANAIRRIRQSGMHFWKPLSVALRSTVTGITRLWALSAYWRAGLMHMPSAPSSSSTVF